MVTTVPAITPRNGLGVSALVLGIIGLVFSWVPVLGLILGILALALGVVGYRRVRDHTADNLGMAVTGIITGIITVVIGSVILVAVGSAASAVAHDPALNVTTTSGGDSTLLVGKEITPGTYRTAGPRPSDFMPMCSWARLSGTSGELSDIIANDISQGPTTVTISATDNAFKTVGCQPWVRTGS